VELVVGCIGLEHSAKMDSPGPKNRLGIAWRVSSVGMIRKISAARIRASLQLCTTLFNSVGLGSKLCRLSVVQDGPGDQMFLCSPSSSLGQFCKGWNWLWLDPLSTAKRNEWTLSTHV